ncbi:hypothetical protein ACTTZI_004184 [Vibrio vulnificus]
MNSKTKFFLPTIIGILSSGFVHAKNMTFDDAVNNLDGFTTEQPAQDRLEKEWVIHNKPAENAVIPVVDTLELIANNVNSKTYNLGGKTGMFLIYGSGGDTALFYIANDTEKTQFSSTSIASNEGFGYKVDNGVITATGYHGSPTIGKIFRLIGSSEGDKSISNPQPETCMKFEGRHNLNYTPKYGVVLYPRIAKVSWGYTEVLNFGAGSSWQNSMIDYTPASDGHEYKRWVMSYSDQKAHWYGVCRRKVAPPPEECPAFSGSYHVTLGRMFNILVWQGRTLQQGSQTYSDWTTVGEYKYKRKVFQGNDKYSVCRIKI